MVYVEIRRHTMRLKPRQYLSQAGVTLARRLGDTMGPFERVVTSPVARAFETAIAMGFAVDEQDDIFGLTPDEVLQEVRPDYGFATLAAQYRVGGKFAQWSQLLGNRVCELGRVLSVSGCALIICHGISVEASAIAAYPQGDFASWGPNCDYCEGARLYFDEGRCVCGEVLRVKVSG